MHILLIITDYGSFNNFLSELAIKLVSNGHQVDVICSPEKIINYRDKHAYTSLDIKFHYVNMPRSVNPVKVIKASKQINSLIEKIGPSVINVHFTTGIFTTLLWRKPACFTIGTLHGLGYPIAAHPLKRTLFKSIEQFCFKRLDQICLINEIDFELVKQLHPQKAFKHKSFGVGNDLQKFNPEAVSPATREAIRKTLYIKPDDFVLVFTGRFVVFKGFDRVIKAFNSLINDYRLPDIKLITIGGKDPIHQTGLNEHDNELYQNNEHIINIGFTADVNLYLSIADVFVFPSKKEGMPVCIMEALSMGVPVITANSRGCKELVKNDFNGLLLTDNPTVSETREAILKLYRNRSLLRHLSANALTKRSELNRQVFVEDQIAVYHQAGNLKDFKSAS